VSETKTCQDCIDLLADYVDETLPEDMKSRLEEHLGGCQPCEDFLSTYRATTSVCRKVMARSIPDSVATRLHAFLRQEIGKDKASGS
jgi:anti-sigma factor RsiW